MRRCYLDHAATTPPCAAAIEAMQPLLEEPFGNASSLHREGQRARAVVEEARSLVAGCLGCHDDEIVFTGSGTEAINLALRGVTWANRAGRRAHLVTSAIEHDAVLRTARWLAERGHANLEVVAPEADGRIRTEAVLDAVRPDTALVSVMWVNNETGAVQPVEEIGRALRVRGTLFHVDAVAALGRLDAAVGELPADLVSLSAHKVGGPKGCGVLLVRRGVELEPVLTGGAQEDGLRPGTESVAAIAGTAAAIADAATHRATRAARLALLSRRLEAGLLALPGLGLNAARAPRAPGIVSARFEGVSGSALLQALDLRGFSVSTGSACSSGSPRPSHVLRAMGQSSATAGAALRLSLSAGTREEEVDDLLAVLPELLDAARTKVTP